MSAAPENTTRASSPAGSLAPTTSGERMQTLDVLRGVALFGVLLANLNTGYDVRGPFTRLDEVFRWIQGNLIEGRFYTLLGFLFGIGFALQIGRARARHTDVSAMYVRRMAALFVIGVAHGTLIWRGDILTFYALIGVVLLPYSALSQRGLLFAAAATFFGASALQGVVLSALHAHAPSLDSPSAIAVYAHGTMLQILPQRVHDYLSWYGWFILAGGAGFLTLFLLGLWVGRSGIVQQLPRRRSMLRTGLGAAVVCCAIGLVVQHYLNVWWVRPAELPVGFAARARLAPRFIAGLVAGNLAVWSTSAIYAFSLALLHLRGGWSERLAPLAAAGRMSLTTYLTQSVVCTFLFYGFGLGWYGHAGYTAMFSIAVCLFSLQLWASTWWLKRYRFGPVEWLWRSLAYGTIQPMKLRADPEPLLARAQSALHRL